MQTDISKQAYTRNPQMRICTLLHLLPPHHQKTSIPYSQAIHLQWICSTPELFWTAARQLSENLYVRGYPKQMTKTAIQRASQRDWKILLQPTTPRGHNEKIIPFTTVYNPFNPPIGKIIGKNIFFPHQQNFKNCRLITSWLSTKER